jgi:L-ascorbate metabolism protein UlaG (beta-lactamase superfamily)
MTSIETFTKAIKAIDGAQPTFGHQPQRTDAFLEMGAFFEQGIRPDQPFDLAQNPNPVWQQIEQRLLTALDGIEQASSQDPPTLWQMYNSGVIVRCGKTVFGMDVIPMLRSYGWPEPDGLTQRIAGLLDFLLITHRHPDHFDAPLVKACLALGKPVLMPASLASQQKPPISLHSMEDGSEMTLHGVHLIGRSAFHVWRDTIEELALTYYEITLPNGYRMLFSGDADYTKVFSKTPNRKIDLLFLPWRNPNAAYEDGDPAQTGTTLDAVTIAINRIQPQHILFEHYAELEHVYQYYPASYDMVAQLQKDLPVPADWLFWGESCPLP